MAGDTDVAIVGAGPAGSACAAMLAESDYEVSLIDKHEFPRDKACGDGLTPHAVEVLSQLGLDGLLEEAHPIQGYRVILDHRRGVVSRFPGDAKGRCVPRAALDEALLKVALARGARFVKGRAQGFESEVGDREASAVLASESGMSRSIEASRIVASDGATSVMRRSANLGPAANSVRAWAIRGYFATERSLDEFFDVYMPLEVRGMVLVGYGWVFPVEERVANIGVGYFRPWTTEAWPRFNVALAAFVDELRIREVRRFGDIEPLGQPIGAPIAGNFSRERCDHENLLFVGDAAGTTDPITGEGISAAIDSGLLAAKHIDHSLKGGGSLAGYGRQLDRRMPRVSQDLSMIVRSVGRLDQSGDLAYARPRNLNFLLTAASIGLDVDLFPDLDATPIVDVLRGVDPSAAELLREVHNKLLDDLTTTFPFAKPMIVRELRKGGGLVYAATLVSSYRACGGSSDDRAKLGAQASECLTPFTSLISRLSDRPRKRVEKLNNALAILSADFAVSQSLVAVAEVGPDAAVSFARTAQQVCEGGMLDAVGRYDLGRSPKRYLAATESRVGSVFGFAAALGAELAGCAGSTVEHLRHYGRMLGVAYTIAEDMNELSIVDDTDRWALISSLRNGKYGLPLLLAARRDPTLRQRIVAEPSSHELQDLVAHVQESGGADEAREFADLCIDSARTALEDAAPSNAASLDALVSWVECRAAPDDLTEMTTKPPARALG